MKVLTGITPTNILHIGNLFGALKPAVELQKEHELFMMIADYHAITVKQDPEQLNENILFATAAYLASGIDPKKAVLFQQSQVSAHTELGWILQTVARIGEAKRMTQFKDKSGDKQDSVSVGLFTYPTLMASDILLYDIEAVPVGADQKQHVEFTRDLAERFNRDFGETFIVPKVMIPKHGAKILALNDPQKKMSKSAESAKNYISLMDEEDIIHKKIRSAVTDSEHGITADESRRGLHNLLSIYHLVTEESVDQIVARYQDQGMKELKDDLAEKLTNYLKPIQDDIKNMMENKDELAKVISTGSEAANEIANKTLTKAKKHLGVLI